jgi:putative membrane protein
MKNFLIDNYLFIKSLHVIAVICWMAGMLYLPRLFVYHATVKADSPESNLLKVMEYRLLKYIMNPAMIASFLFGFAMIYSVGFSGYGKSIHVKVFLAFIMAGIHGMLSAHLKKFAKNLNTKSHVYFRVLNEVPTLLMIIIVFLAITKPF